MNDMTRQRIVLEVPGMELTTVERNIAWREAGGALLGLDVYRPPAVQQPLPAVLFVTGYPDEGFKGMVGCYAKDMGMYDSWGRLLAASGIIAVAYENRDPAADAGGALDFVRGHAAEFGVDVSRIGIWSSSGNVPNALSLFRDRGTDIACAAMLYGYTFDLDGDTHVRDAAATYRFAHRPDIDSLDGMPAGPLLLVRAGCDETPGLNASIDRFVAHALQHNLDLTLCNFPAGHHAFDLNDDTDESRKTIRAIVAWLRHELEVST